MKEAKAVDISRFFLVLLVIAIHCGLQDWSVSAYNLCQMSVPCFFVISGYFIEHRISGKWGGYLINYKNRILRLYLMWSVLYFPLMILGCTDNDFPLWKDIILGGRDYLTIGSSHGSGHMWYIYALFWGCVLLEQIVYKSGLSNKKIIVITSLVLALGYFMEYTPDLLISKWYFLFFGTTRNGIFQGFPFLVIGVMICRLNFVKIAQKHPMPIIASLILLIPLSSQFHPTKSLFITPIVCGLIITLLLSIDLTSFDSMIPIREISVWIYYLHMYVLFCIDDFFVFDGFYLRYIVVSVFSVFVGILVYKLSIKFKVFTYFR